MERAETRVEGGDDGQRTAVRRWYLSVLIINVQSNFPCPAWNVMIDWALNILRSEYIA